MAEPHLPMSPDEIRVLRRREEFSRADLAFEIGVPIRLVGRWERGLATPEGPALRLLELLRDKGLMALR